jgi:secondary thiamine-phosphate synthase enzyme
MILTEKLVLLSEGGFHVHNVTEQVREVVRRSAVREGSALVYYTHTTGGLIIVEHEAGMLVDLEDALEKIAPASADYRHHLRGYDFNGAAHIATSLMGVSVTVPVLDGDLLMGGYQDILLVDMEPQPKARTVVIQVQGEA